MPADGSTADDDRSIDLAFAAAWPAAESVADEGWLLRASAGVTRRANSALALGAIGDVDERLAGLERWYRERGLVPRVQVVPSSPAGLAGILSERGWAIGDGACVLMESAPVTRGARARRPAWALAAADAPSDAWVEVWWEVSPRGGAVELDHALAILGRVPVPRRFVVASAPDGCPVGSALGVLVGETLVLESVATRGFARRQGVCRALTVSLVEWAVRGGGRRAVLTVERDNLGGVAAWERLGFRERSGWTYAVAPAR